MPPQSTLDIQAARARTSFDPQVLHRVLLSGHKDPDVRKRVAQLLADDPAFDKRSRPYLSRAQQIERGLSTTKALFDLVDRHDLDHGEYLEALVSAMDEPIGLNLHEIAFAPVLASQGSDEQQAEWLPKCYHHEILGAYLQTELGHGSNVQQLETTATYDSKTDEFVLHSPTISATKWWIGALGVLATHGVVQARLFIKGKDHGPHLFILQLRSLEDHSLMPGIEAGEIGPKVHSAMGSVDNGWARFNSVRIPRSQMLSRFASVDPKDGGTYITPPHSKLSYGGMIFIRAQMISNLSWREAKAATISLRYLHMRRQFADPELNPGEERVEKQVISYPGVYMRVVPELANCIVFMLAGKDMANLYHSMASRLSTGDTSLLASTHAVSSGLKVYVSTRVVAGIEVFRRSMGGHGMLASSGVGRVFATELPAQTYEGENGVLSLQVARAALKSLAAAVAAKGGSNHSKAKLATSPFDAYLSALDPRPALPVQAPSTPEGWTDRAFLTRLLALRAALSVVRLADQMRSAGKKFGDLSWECADVSDAVVEAFLAKRTGEMLDALEGAGDKERDVMQRVVTLFLLSTLTNALAPLLELSILAPSAAADLRAAQAAAARALLPDLVGLTDSFGFSDWELDTAVGNADGAVYERMLEKAKADEELNLGSKQEQERLYRTYIRPVLERGRKRAGRTGAKL
ncbi:hypothetical protein DMC30DRAFT_447253 [Rhodotorula diobovata]|uniref:Acyl-coenzyme A oxidase n=1 Tax=Rhodotorula diobovata TaxID=5288 RepID=A0A5C5FVC5_9BASI|nr:hypothetical protein DMC30DRAFT_447253 [Rhodotorula diobovata]